MIWVGLGGGLGAMARYGISLFPWPGLFPWGTLLVNLFGAFAIGLFSGWSQARGMDSAWALFLIPGLCGGFTTFSTFSLESFRLWEEGQNLLALAYMGLSLFLCLGGVALGMGLAKRLA